MLNSVFSLMSSGTLHKLRLKSEITFNNATLQEKVQTFINSGAGEVHIPKGQQNEVRSSTPF